MSLRNLVKRGARRTHDERRAARVVVITLVCVLAAGTVATPATELSYDARIAWIKAGTADVRLEWQGFGYTLSGFIATSRFLEPFFHWTGRFIARGVMVDDTPESQFYFLETRERDEHSILSLANGEVSVYDDRKGWRSFEAPEGVDVLSALYLARNCFKGPRLHDGEDSYPIELIDRKAVRLTQTSRYFSGEAERCRYRAHDLRGRERRVVVWLADVDGQPLPVKLRVSIPFAPDGYMLLRMR